VKRLRACGRGTAQRGYGGLWSVLRGRGVIGFHITGMKKPADVAGCIGFGLCALMVKCSVNMSAVHVEYGEYIECPLHVPG
jgi:hypothetical protein